MIIEDHLVYRLGLKTLINKTLKEVQFIENFPENTLEGWKEFFAKKEKIDLVICDLRMPEVNGFEIAEIIKHENPKIKLLIHTTSEDPLTIKKLKSLQIDGLVFKSVSTDELVFAVQRILKGLNYFPESYHDLDRSHILQKELNNEDLSLILLMLRGKTSKEISEYLGKKKFEIDYKRKTILKKIDCKNLLDLKEYYEKNQDKFLDINI
jgi:DNA-binding NarL/FixJ family response regulator